MNKKQIFLEKDFNAQSETMLEKNYKKSKIVRDEFETTEKYGIPIIKKQNIRPEFIKPWGYKLTKANDNEHRDRTVHFFTYDWHFENVYSNPETALEKLDKYYALMTPQFSMYNNMPIALQIYSTFKNRWCGAYWQKNGMRVIPTVSWSTNTECYEFCFDGIEKGGAVAVSTYKLNSYEREFMPGYNKMLEVIQPSVIFCYGEPFKAMNGNIKFLDPYDHAELIRILGKEEYTQRHLAGTLYPSN